MIGRSTRAVLGATQVFALAACAGSAASAVMSDMPQAAPQEVRQPIPQTDSRTSAHLAPLSADDQRELEQAFALIKRDYVVPVDDDKLMIGALKGMVGDLDPHSTFYDRTEFARLQEQLAGGFAGVGLTVEGGEEVPAAPTWI